MKKNNIIMLVIGLIIFVAVIVGLIVFIYKSSDLSGNNQNDYEEINAQKNEDVNTEVYKTTRKQNGLKFNIEASYPDVILDDTVDIESYRTVSKFEVYGLKDSKIQDEINSQIRTMIESAQNANYRINIIERANFSDVLSLEVYISEGEDDELKYLKTGLNYRLDTGVRLYFTDIFTGSDAASEVLETELVRRAISDKNKDNINDLEFTFTTNQIYIYNLGEDGDKELERNITISLPEYADKVDVFTKFVSANDLYTEKASTNETLDFIPVSENGEAKKMDNNTYLIQYYTTNVDESKKQKLETMASDELLKISTDTKKQVIIQNIGLNDKTGTIITEIYDIKEDYFETKDFYVTLSNTNTLEGMMFLEFDEDNINSYDKLTTQKTIN